jgi:hypothetical protein
VACIAALCVAGAKAAVDDCQNYEEAEHYHYHCCCYHCRCYCHAVWLAQPRGDPLGL